VGRAGGKFQLTEVAVDDDYSPHHSDVYEDDYDIHYDSGRGYCLIHILPSPHTSAEPETSFFFIFHLCIRGTVARDGFWRHSGICSRPK
jgi:hypothetical protein